MSGKSARVNPIALAVSISAGGALPVFLIGSLSVEEGKSLGISTGDAAFLVALFFAAAAFGAAGLGKLTDVLGARVMMQIGAAGTGAGTLIMSGSDIVFLFALGTVLAGVAYGASQPAVSRFLSESVRETRHGTAFGLRQTGVPVATLLAGLAAALTSASGDWRIAYFGPLALSVANLTLLYRVVGAAAGPESVGPAEPKPNLVGWPLLTLLGGSLGLGAGTIYVIASFSVPSARFIGISAAYAGVIGAVGGGMALLSRVTAGILADALRFAPLRVAGIMLISGASGYLLLSTQAKDLVVVGIFVAFSIGSGWNALFLLSLSRDFPGNSGKATGIGLAGAYVGGVLGPLVFGLIFSSAGFTVAWLVEGVVAVCAGAGALVAWSMIRRLSGGITA